MTEAVQARRELVENERRFRALIENSADGIALLAADGTVTYASPSTGRILGGQAGDWLGGLFLNRVHPDEAGALAETWTRLMAAPSERQSAEFRYRRLDDTWCWLEATGANLLAEPAVGAVVANFRDITERRAAEAVRRALFEIMHGLAATADLQVFLGLVHASIARLVFAENFFVVLHDPATGLFHEVYTVDQADPPAEPSRMEKSISAYVFRTGQPLRLSQADYEVLAAQGEVELVGTNSPSWLGAPLKTARGTIGVMAVQDYERDDRYTDRDAEVLATVASQVAVAVERKQAEAALAASERRFRALIENAPDGITLLDADSRLLYASPAVERLLGYQPEAILGQTAAMFTHPDDVPAVAAALQRVLSQPSQADLNQYRARHQDGTYRWIEGALSNQLADPSVRALVFNFRDITERRQRERELEAVAGISAALRQAADRDEMLPAVLDQVMELLDAAGSWVALRDRPGAEVLLEAGRGTGANYAGQHLAPGKGVSGWVMETGQVFVSADARTEPRIGSPGALAASPAVACVPLIAHDSTLGVLWAARRRPFEPDEVSLLRSLADIVASALQRATLFRQTEAGVQRLTALRAIDQAINSSMDLRITLYVLLEQATQQLGIDAAAVLLLDEASHSLTFAAGHGFLTRGLEQTRLRLGQGHAGQAALERRLVNVPDLEAARPPFTRAALIAGERFVSYVSAPLVAKGRAVGVLECFHRSAHTPTPEWLSFFETLADQAAIAIEQARLFERLERTNVDLELANNSTLEGWAAALDLRAGEREGHSLRAAEWTLRLARALAVPDDQHLHLRRGALLHDLGLLGVPDHLLLKPGPLTDEEWTQMRRHPQVAYDLLMPIAHLRPALDIPYSHHERWDGAGYPRGLEGETIPLAARLFAAVDVWMALRAHRPYRAAWGAERARAHLLDQAGKQFDPAMVDAFINLGPD
jgi:PAS domain S-box-containing protein